MLAQVALPRNKLIKQNYYLAEFVYKWGNNDLALYKLQIGYVRGMKRK
jgi:hypothetical protein